MEIGEYVTLHCGLWGYVGMLLATWVEELIFLCVKTAWSCVLNLFMFMWHCEKRCGVATGELSRVMPVAPWVRVIIIQCSRRLWACDARCCGVQLLKQVFKSRCKGKFDQTKLEWVHYFALTPSFVPGIAEEHQAQQMVWGKRPCSFEFYIPTSGSAVTVVKQVINAASLDTL